MAYSITPSLGADINYNGDKPYYDDNSPTPTPAIGTVVKGSDGVDHMFVKASADISAASSPGTQVTLTLPAATAAAGSGGWYAPIAGVTSGDFFWARKGTP